MTYVTYENRANPHTTIHLEGCSQIAKHGGKHRYNQGHYRSHVTYRLAEKYAQKSGLPWKCCFFCNPPDGKNSKKTRN